MVVSVSSRGSVLLSVVVSDKSVGLSVGISVTSSGQGVVMVLCGSNGFDCT